MDQQPTPNPAAAAALPSATAQPAWSQFGVRLARAIDRWPGGGQKAFARALAAHAAGQRLKLHTSYRTLVNYLNGQTHPSVAWVEAAAAVLGWSAQNLLTGEGPERPGEEQPSMQPPPAGAAAARQRVLTRSFIERSDLPMPARWMIFHFLDDYFASRARDWTADVQTEWAWYHAEVDAAVREHFGPLLTRPAMPYAETMALAASLTAAAYVRLAAARRPTGRHADAEA